MPEPIKISLELPINISVNVKDLVIAADGDVRLYPIIFDLMRRHCDRHELRADARLFKEAAQRCITAIKG